jgi:hypothetical protein
VVDVFLGRSFEPKMCDVDRSSRMGIDGIDYMDYFIEIVYWLCYCPLSILFLIYSYIYRFHMIPWFFWMVHFSPHIQPMNVHMDSYRTSAHFIPGAGHPNHLLTVGLKEAVASSFWGNSRAFPTSHSVKLSLSTSLPFQHLLGCVTCKPRRLSVLYFRHLLKGKSCALGRTGMSKIWKWWISNVYIHNSIMHWSYSNGCSGPQMVNANGKQNRSSLNVESHTWYTCRSSCNMHRKSSILYHMILCIDNTVHIRSI